jgi:photosystem II stability/assembly factor-like uncharacterized protein
VSTGIAVGDNGTILRTENSGTRWTAVRHGASTNLRDIVFTDRNNGFICGEMGTLLSTHDGGKTWHRIQ